MMTIYNLITAFCGIGIVISVVCRLRKMGSSTRWSVSLAYSLLGFGAACVAVAPFVQQWGFRPHPVVVVFVAAQLAVLIAMRNLWLGGPPESAQKNSAGSGGG